VLFGKVFKFAFTLKGMPFLQYMLRRVI
jgi:hypothetical protein